jgi:toxin CcdB
MAQFDYYVRRSGQGYVVDCQAGVLAHLDTRFVVPLLPLDVAPIPAAHLNPEFEIGDKRYSLVTQFAATVPLSELRKRAGSLESERYRIGNALDFLLTGV